LLFELTGVESACEIPDVLCRYYITMYVYYYIGMDDFSSPTISSITDKLRPSLTGTFMSPAENKQIAERFIVDIWNKGNLEEVSRFVTPDFIYHARGEDVKGTENLKEWVSSDRSIFPDIRFTIVNSIAESNKVATAWFVEATHEKEFRGIPATHKKFETVGMNVFHFEGDKIKEAWFIADGLTPALEIGVVETKSNET
jgi:steroid delta-isomerase-like uncharacterized protein